MDSYGLGFRQQLKMEPGHCWLSNLRPINGQSIDKQVSISTIHFLTLDLMGYKHPTDPIFRGLIHEPLLCLVGSMGSTNHGPFFCVSTKSIQ